MICLVSDTLANLYRPEDTLGSNLSKLRRDIQKVLRPKLETVKQLYGIKEQANAGVTDLIECIKALDGDPTAKPTKMPLNAEGIMAYMAIGSPAICAYRMFLRGSEDRQKSKALAAETAEVFVSMFNKPESSGILDLLYSKCSERGYYRYVFQYCAEGNLQAMLDEYAHVLSFTGEKLKNAIKESAVGTVTLPVDIQETFPAKKKVMMRCHYAVGYYNAVTSDDKTITRVERVRNSFNSPFRPFVLSTTSIGQEGLDFHCYCRKVVHWNLPANPIDLEQREGRINRFKCLAVRKNIANRYKNLFSWDDMFDHAAGDLKGKNPDLVPYWCLPDSKQNTVKIERIVPMYPFSQDPIRYDRIIKILSLYRLTLGQPRQEELITILDKNVSSKIAQKLFMNLSPYYHQEDQE